MAKYLIIDGSAILHRAYHALPPFTAKDGTPTNAVHGFVKMLITLLRRVEPSYMAVVFDTPKPTFRKLLLPSYQAQRPKAPDDYKVQVPLTQEFLEKARLSFYLKEGYEADDVIATIVRQVKQKHPAMQFFIATGDKDILQLVDKTTMILMPKSGMSSLNYMDKEAVRSLLGVEAEQVVDYKALVGDPSDNYSGVKGVGPVTAQKLLYKYKTLEGIYEHLAQLEPNLAKKLREEKNEAMLSQRLARLVSDVELAFRLEASAFKGINLNQELESYCDRLSLHSIKKQLGAALTATKKPQVDNNHTDQLSFF